MLRNETMNERSRMEVEVMNERATNAEARVVVVVRRM